MDLTTLARGQRTAGRLAQIVTILCKYSLADWLKALDVRPVRKFLTSFDGQPIAGLSTEVRIRMALTEMGTTFIKLGQILSTRPDLVGPALANELSSLQDDTPADPPDTAHPHRVGTAQAPQGAFRRVRGDGIRVGVHRSGPSRSPARWPASCCQSAAPQHRGQGRHRSRHHDGPGRTGREIQRRVAKLSTARHDVRVPPHLLRELDFRRELRNIQEFIHNFQGDTAVRFPTPHPALSSQRVLTLDYLDGISIGDTARLKQAGHDLRTIARSGANIILGMIFRDGFYHADPHPGNLLVLPNTVIGVLDCGMVGRLDDHTRDAFTTMLLAAIGKDSSRFTDMVMRLARVPADLDRDAFESEIHDFLADYGTQSLNHFDVSGALNGITDIIRRYHLLLPANLAPLLKAMIVLEGTSRQLDRSFSLAEMIRPYVTRVIQEKLSPRRIFRHWRRLFLEWDHLLRTLPGDVGDILDRTKRGQFKFHLEHRRLETSVALLVDGLLSASLFLGSTLMLCHRVLAEPWLDISIPGALGLPCSLFLVWRSLRAAKKSRNET